MNPLKNSPAFAPEAFAASLLHFINEQLPKLDRHGRIWNAVGADTLLFESGRLDSLSILHLIACVEELTGHPVPDHLVVMKHFRSVEADDLGLLPFTFAMNPNPALAVRHGERRVVFERLDANLRAWALEEGSDEHDFPVLIAADTLRRAEYPDAFPHLLMAPAVAHDPAVPLARGNALLTDTFLSPAVCYHAYAELAHTTLVQRTTLTARGHCFRNEDSTDLVPGRRQVEFEMREVILIGAPDWIEDRLAALKPGVESLASKFGLNAQWQAANDPFFLPSAQGKAHMQRLLGTKIEFCLPDGLAVASINRHRTFFGERFEISTADGAPAHSACIAFGLDRWAAQITNPTNPL